MCWAKMKNSCCQWLPIWEIDQTHIVFFTPRKEEKEICHLALYAKHNQPEALLLLKKYHRAKGPSGTIRPQKKHARPTGFLAAEHLAGNRSAKRQTRQKAGHKTTHFRTWRRNKLELRCFLLNLLLRSMIKFFTTNEASSIRDPGTISSQPAQLASKSPS